MKELLLFTDGSVNTLSKIGYGAYLVIPEIGVSLESLNPYVKRFENTSSTKLELQTLLWALSQIEDLDFKVIVYTDSQNIIGLEGRRKRLEKNDYKSANNMLLKNHALYKEFYAQTDRLNCEFRKVSGHLKSKDKNDIDRLFTIVDRSSRNALRKES